MLDSMYKSYMKKITLYNQRKIGRDHYFLPRKNHEIYFPRQLLSQPGQWTYSIKKSVKLLYRIMSFQSVILTV